MSAVFIVSLDCEGKWGLANQISDYHNFINTKSLTNTYQNLVSEFEKYDLSATFAFVGAFLLTDTELKQNKDRLLDVTYEGDNWLKHFRLAEKENNFDGWNLPAALDIVDGKKHEIACHGFTHVPFDCPTTEESLLEHDLECAHYFAKQKGYELKTFVYPGNRVSRTHLMSKFGFAGYREELVAKGGALGSIGREVNVFSKSQAHSRVAHDNSDNSDNSDNPDDPVIIPSGYFFNWRKGLRSKVPRSVTVTRWKSIIDNAVRKQSVAHLWLHPHNLIDGPSTAGVLSEVLRYAADCCNAGKLQCMTQVEYVDHVNHVSRNSVSLTA